MSGHLSLHALARSLGGEVTGRRVRAPGPGHSHMDRSMWVFLSPEAPDGFICGSFAGDAWTDCKDHVRGRLGLAAFTPYRSERPSKPTPIALEREADGCEARQRIRQAAAIWRAAGPIEGTPAEAYLASRHVPYRGEALRWHPACPFGGDRVGAMIALVRNIVSNKAQAIHRTAIDTGGRKLSNLGSNGRLALGPTACGAVKLTDDPDVTTVLALGVGIETTLSIPYLPDLMTMPIWSVLSANGIASFPALAGLESIWISADNDALGTGATAAIAAAGRLQVAGLEVIILSPSNVGTDLNDMVSSHVGD